MKERLRADIKELVGLIGVSGAEQEVVSYLKDAFTPYADCVWVDNIGNLFAEKKGNKPGPRADDLSTFRRNRILYQNNPEQWVLAV